MPGATTVPLPEPLLTWPSASSTPAELKTYQWYAWPMDDPFQVQLVDDLLDDCAYTPGPMLPDEGTGPHVKAARFGVARDDAPPAASMQPTAAQTNVCRLNDICLTPKQLVALTGCRRQPPVPVKSSAALGGTARFPRALTGLDGL